MERPIMDADTIGKAISKYGEISIVLNGGEFCVQAYPDAAGSMRAQSPSLDLALLSYFAWQRAKPEAPEPA
jgi:hypothetical protein